MSEFACMLGPIISADNWFDNFIGNDSNGSSGKYDSAAMNNAKAHLNSALSGMNEANTALGSIDCSKVNVFARDSMKDIIQINMRTIKEAIGNVQSGISVIDNKIKAIG